MLVLHKYTPMRRTVWCREHCRCVLKGATLSNTSIKIPSNRYTFEFYPRPLSLQRAKVRSQKTDGWSAGKRVLYIRGRPEGGTHLLYLYYMKKSIFNSIQRNLFIFFFFNKNVRVSNIRFIHTYYSNPAIRCSPVDKNLFLSALLFSCLLYSRAYSVGCVYGLHFTGKATTHRAQGARAIAGRACHRRLWQAVYGKRTWPSWQSAEEGPPPEGEGTTCQGGLRTRLFWRVGACTRNVVHARTLSDQQHLDSSNNRRQFWRVRSRAIS